MSKPGCVKCCCLWYVQSIELENVSVIQGLSSVVDYMDKTNIHTVTVNYIPYCDTSHLWDITNVQSLYVRNKNN